MQFNLLVVLSLSALLWLPAAAAQPPLYVGQVQTEQSVTLYSMVSGLIKQLPVRGQRLQQGALIVDIEVADNQYRMEKSQSEVNYHGQAIAIYQKQLARFVRLQDKDFASTQRIDELQAQLAQHKAKLQGAKSELKFAKVLAQYRQIRAPFDGQLILVDKKVGEYVQKGERIGFLQGQDEPFIALSLPLVLAKKLDVGTKILAKPADGERFFHVTVLDKLDSVSEDAQRVYLRLSAFAGALIGESVMVQVAPL